MVPCTEHGAWSLPSAWLFAWARFQTKLGWCYKSQLVFDCTRNFVDLSANEWDPVLFVWKWDFVNFLHRLPFSHTVALAYVLTVCCNHWAKVSAPGNTLPWKPRRHSYRIPWPPERHVWGKSDSVYLKNNFSDTQNWCHSSHTRNHWQKLISQFFFLFVSAWTFSHIATGKSRGGGAPYIFQREKKIRFGMNASQGFAPGELFWGWWEAGDGGTEGVT